eukprot:CAMPEP_0167742522 /NCGR_PEP_ID=MMETSP0110_2-20121227/1482_1 /TAXON_ID=629695 /ORGANISM="Gymnochlora sp., Strain CCMP2014" /LENGTH=292 /DNA_ID=CAMNT_0007626741 /DNA_START=54 /DNA_END=932 /DNA_ORIENTATION=-
MFSEEKNDFIVHSDLQTRLSLDDKSCEVAINEAIRSQRLVPLTIERSGTSTVAYKWRTDQQMQVKRSRDAKLHDLKDQERMVYQEIEKAGNKGIKSDSLKFKTGIRVLRKLNEIVDKLLRRNLVKALKAVGSQHKKIYMLYGIEPSREVVGGVWYDEGKFDKEVVDALYNACYYRIKNEGMKSAKELSDSLNKMHLLNNAIITELDIEYILNALELDGKLEKVRKRRSDSGKSGKVEGRDKALILYRLKVGGRIDSSFTEIPCAACPVASKCGITPEINPQNCAYFDSWIEF